MKSFNIHFLPDHYISELFIRRVHALGIIEKNKFVVKSMNSNGMEMDISDLEKSFPHLFFVLDGRGGNFLRSICGANDVVYIHRLDAVSEKVVNSMYGLVKGLSWVYWGEVESYSRYQDRRLFYSKKTIDFIKRQEWERASILKKVAIKSQLLKAREELRSKFLLKRRKRIMGMLDKFLHWSEFDYKYLIDKYSVSAKKFPEFLLFSYGSALIDSRLERAGRVNDESNESGLNIMLGHSAELAVNHLDGFDALDDNFSRFKSPDFKIFCPLAYGRPGYKKHVISEGASRFGEKFVPLENRVSKEEYLEFLSTIDVAILPVRHSAAAGNVLSMLALGKVIFLFENSSLYKFFRHQGFQVYPLSDLAHHSINEIVKKHDSSVNKSLIKKRFGREAVDLRIVDIFG